MEIGIDIEENDRFKNLSDTFLKRAYTPKELEYANSVAKRYEVYCAYWCVKESVIKAFGNRKISFQDINICREPSGKPFIEKNAIIMQELKKLDLKDIKISMSNTNLYSTATCLIY